MKSIAHVLATSLRSLSDVYLLFLWSFPAEPRFRPRLLLTLGRNSTTFWIYLQMIWDKYKKNIVDITVRSNIRELCSWETRKRICYVFLKTPQLSILNPLICLEMLQTENIFMPNIEAVDLFEVGSYSVRYSLQLISSCFIVKFNIVL